MVKITGGIRMAEVSDLLTIPYEDAEAMRNGRGRMDVGDDVWQAFVILWRLGAARFSHVGEWCESRAVSPAVERLIWDAGYGVELDQNRWPLSVYEQF